MSITCSTLYHPSKYLQVSLFCITSLNISHLWHFKSVSQYFKKIATYLIASLLMVMSLLRATHKARWMVLPSSDRRLFKDAARAHPRSSRSQGRKCTPTWSVKRGSKRDFADVCKRSSQSFWFQV